MNYLKKNFPIFLLSGSLIFVGVTSINQAEAATATIASLQKEIVTLKKEILTLKIDVAGLRECINLNAIVQNTSIFQLWTNKPPFKDDQVLDPKCPKGVK